MTKDDIRELLLDTLRVTRHGVDIEDTVDALAPLLAS